MQSRTYDQAVSEGSNLRVKKTIWARPYKAQLHALSWKKSKNLPSKVIPAIETREGSSGGKMFPKGRRQTRGPVTQMPERSNRLQKV